jgi:hypothetical protein
VRADAHGVTAIHTATDWATKNAPMPSAPSTATGTDGSRPRPIAGIPTHVSTDVASQTSVSSRARRTGESGPDVEPAVGRATFRMLRKAGAPRTRAQRTVRR